MIHSDRFRRNCFRPRYISKKVYGKNIKIKNDTLRKMTG